MKDKSRDLKKNIYFICVYVCDSVLYMWVSMKARRRHGISLDVELQTVTDSYKLLGTRLASSERAGSALTAEPSLMMWNGDHDHTEWAIGWLWEKELQREKEEGKERACTVSLLPHPAQWPHHKAE